MKFKIGDQVVLIGETAGYDEDVLPVGSLGKIVSINGVNDTCYPPIGVRWENFTHGHSCKGRCAGNSGYYVYGDEIEHLIGDDGADVDISSLL